MEFEELVTQYKDVLKKHRILESDRHSFHIPNEEQEILNQHIEHLNTLYNQIYEASIKEKRFFFGASFEVFLVYLKKKEGEERGKSNNFSIYTFYKNFYLAQYEHLKKTPEEFTNLSVNIRQGFRKVVSKRLEYLELTMYEMGINIIKIRPYESSPFNITFEDNLERRFLYEKQQTPLNNFNYSVKWNGTNTELAEIIKALIESNKLENGLTQSEIFKRFSMFFNYEINETTGIKDFSKRKNTGGNLTKFLDTLKDNLDNWYIKKEEKKRNSR